MNTNTIAGIDKDVPLDMRAVAKNPAEWLAFSPPQWSAQSYDESPLSSTEQSFANSQVDGTFNGTVDPYPTLPTVPSTTYQNSFNGGSPDPMVAAFPYVNLSSITEDHADLDDDMEDTPVPVSNPIIPSPLSSPSIRQPAWGTSRPSRRGSASSAKSRHHRRTKSGSSDTSNSNSANSPSSSHKLRSTSNSNGSRSRPSSSYSSTTTPVARTNHNLIEKQYRTRLNGQFETLLQTLPREVVGDAAEKRVSKAEVLVLAKERIRELEREKRLLEEENQGLEGIGKSVDCQKLNTILRQPDTKNDSDTASPPTIQASENATQENNELQIVPEDILGISLETRLKWVKATSDLFFSRPKLDGKSRVRDWDLLLSVEDGRVENVVKNESLIMEKENEKKEVKEEGMEKAYPARYKLPTAISSRLARDFGELKNGDGREEEEIEKRVVSGEFPDDVWSLEKAPRILACWCPEFAKVMLASRGKASFQETITNYVKTHPLLFTAQVLGGIASLASLAVVPVLGLAGFSAAGPVAGSAAAGWQSSVGLVQAGSLFAWCQSVVMGGAAVGGLLVTGLAGAGVAVGATVAGALDGIVEEKVEGKVEEKVEEKVEVEGEEKMDSGETSGGKEDEGGSHSREKL
ncbi:hypothetical protein G7Y89_g11333 [Cudoniella acicularis]|uniref:BHLH domain-containing protein n=1 Tax=Cudoniella acicularis TaxID=354080 RepID=A0A8H4W0Q9_9HELO|nr:hypothetical protein G7Y89_g11333 [Cudoniella acicularis]